MIQLYKDNFWFLNFKFINFNEFINSDVTKRVSIIDYSIIKSVEFILDLFEQNKNDLQKTNDSIKELFSDRMQNNYKLFNEVIKDIKIQDDIMDFILDAPSKDLI